MGISDITAPPANPNQPASNATSTDAAKYAVVLASISQMAKSATTSTGVSLNSLDVMQALATSFAYNGDFALTVGGQNIPVPNSGNSSLTLSQVLSASGGSSTVSGAMGSATTLYEGSTSATNLGYNSTGSITYNDSPGTGSGMPTITPPAPPVSLPSGDPTVSGPPTLPGKPSISFASNLVLTKNLAMTTATPTSSGTVVASCTASPALPMGLSLSSACAISGTPTTITPQASYTITAKDQSNISGSTTISITVKDAAPTSLSYSSQSAIYFIGGNAITPNTPSNSGGTIVSYSISPALPAGLSMSSSTGIISGTPSSVSPVASANYQITATNSGGTTSDTISITLNYPTPTNVSSFTATDFDYYSVTLNWTSLPSSGFFTGYRYAYQAGSTAPADCSSGTDLGNTTSGTTGVLNLASGTQYSFRLCAYYGQLNGSGASGGLSSGLTATVTTASALQASQVSAGGYHSCAVTTANNVYCWGYNLYGQIGNNSTTGDFQTPQQVVGTSGAGALNNITAVAAGSRFTCALNSSGNVFCWGDNVNGELGNGSSSSTPVLHPVQVVGVGGAGVLSNITKIAVGPYHACAINSSANVYCWGANGAGQLGNNTTTNSASPVQVLGLNGTGFLSNATEKTFFQLKVGERAG